MSQTELETMKAQAARYLGKDKAEQLFAECMRAARLSDVRSPQDKLGLADELCKKGGVAEVIGRTFKVQALLAGAKVPEDK